MPADADVGVRRIVVYSLQTGCTSAAVLNLILAMPLHKAEQLKNLESVILDCYEDTAKCVDPENLVTAMDVVLRVSSSVPMTKQRGTERGRACMDKLIHHVLAGSLPPVECSFACEWLGINTYEQSPLVAMTLASAVKSAVHALLNPRTVHV